jgi:Tfp pilus assembly protein PilV
MDGVTDAMTRGIRSTATQRDEGFTLVEVVVAASILFFVLTAVLGLVMATNQMTVLAKERASVTNLISSRLDWIRSQPFTWVAQTNLASETTTTADGFTVTLTYTVTDKSHVNGTKEVRVVASATKRSRTHLRRRTQCFSETPSTAAESSTSADTRLPRAVGRSPG